MENPCWKTASIRRLIDRQAKHTAQYSDLQLAATSLLDDFSLSVPRRLPKVGTALAEGPEISSKTESTWCCVPLLRRAARTASDGRVAVR